MARILSIPRPIRGKMMINIDKCNRFLSRWSTYTNCTKILGLGSPDELRRGLSERDHQMVEKTIKNFKIKDGDTIDV